MAWVLMPSSFPAGATIWIPACRANIGIALTAGWDWRLKVVVCAMTGATEPTRITAVLYENARRRATNLSITSAGIREIHWLEHFAGDRPPCFKKLSYATSGFPKRREAP